MARYVEEPVSIRGRVVDAFESSHDPDDFILGINDFYGPSSIDWILVRYFGDGSLSEGFAILSIGKTLCITGTVGRNPSIVRSIIGTDKVDNQPVYTIAPWDRSKIWFADIKQPCSHRTASQTTKDNMKLDYKLIRYLA